MITIIITKLKQQLKEASLLIKLTYDVYLLRYIPFILSLSSPSKARLSLAVPIGRVSWNVSVTISVAAVISVEVGTKLSPEDKVTLTSLSVRSSELNLICLVASLIWEIDYTIYIKGGEFKNAKTMGYLLKIHNTIPVLMG